VQECKELVEEMRHELGSFWIYNIYDVCGGDEAAERTLSDWVELAPSGHYRLHRDTLARVGSSKCGAEAAMEKYLKNNEVVQAIHVKAGTPGMTYELTVPDLRPSYRCNI
jgi:hypothetical protein